MFGELSVDIDTNGRVWFVAHEVCSILGYVNTSDTINKHVSPQYLMGSIAKRDGTSGGNPNITIISEEGVFALIMRSHKPQAQKFQEFVYKTIVSMRATGMAMSDEFKQVIEIDENKVYENLQKYKSALLTNKKEIERLNKDIAQQRTQLNQNYQQIQGMYNLDVQRVNS